MNGRPLHEETEQLRSEMERAARDDATDHELRELAAAVSADALLAYAAPKLNRAQRRARR